MANKMLFDDTRALRREQREARIARKRERRQARTLKYQRLEMPAEIAALGADGTAIDERAPEPEAASERPVAVEAEAEAAERETPPAPAPAAQAAADGRAECRRPVAAPAGHDDEPLPDSAEDRRRANPRGSRRERDIERFLARRDQQLSLAREEARERIARVGEEDAVCDALVALAHPEASPWRRHRERLSEAIAGRPDPRGRSGGPTGVPRRRRRRGKNITPGARPGHGARGDGRVRGHRPRAVGRGTRTARRAQRPGPSAPRVLALDRSPAKR